MTEPQHCRVYFDSHADTWIVDEGTAKTSRKVSAVYVMVSSTTVTIKGPGEPPRAYLFCRGRLIVSDINEAYILPVDMYHLPGVLPFKGGVS